MGNADNDKLGPGLFLFSNGFPLAAEPLMDYFPDPVGYPAGRC